MSLFLINNPSSSSGVSVTTNSTADTYGSYAQISASTTARLDRLYVQVKNPTVSNARYILDIATGASSSEVVIARVPLHTQSSSRMAHVELPLTIPSGTRIACRAKCANAGAGVLHVNMLGQDQDSLMTQGATSVTLVTDPGSGSNGFVSCTGSGTTANTFVSTTLATTGADFNTFLVGIRDTTTGAADAMFKIKDDGAVIVENIYHRLTNGDSTLQWYGPFFATVASGSSLTCEMASSSTTAIIADVAIIGANLTASGGSSSVNIGSLMDSIAYAADSTSKSVEVVATTLSDGTAKTDLVYNTSGLTASYQRGGAGTVTSITLATQTSTGAWSSGGFVHKANGVYRLDVPNAALATGADFVTITLGGVSGVRISSVRIDLTGGDPRAATVDANLTQVSGDSTAADNLEAMLDGTGGVTLSAVLGSNAITSASIAADAIGASELATDAVTEIANAVVEAEITALKSYDRSANTTATITGPTSGTTSLTVTTDASYEPIKTL